MAGDLNFDIGGLLTSIFGSPTKTTNTSSTNTAALQQAIAQALGTAQNPTSTVGQALPWASNQAAIANAGTNQQQTNAGLYNGVTGQFVNNNLVAQQTQANAAVLANAAVTSQGQAIQGASALTNANTTQTAQTGSMLANPLVQLAGAGLAGYGLYHNRDAISSMLSDPGSNTAVGRMLTGDSPAISITSPNASANGAPTDILDTASVSQGGPLKVPVETSSLPATGNAASIAATPDAGTFSATSPVDVASNLGTKTDGVQIVPGMTNADMQGVITANMTGNAAATGGTAVDLTGSTGDAAANVGSDASGMTLDVADTPGVDIAGSAAGDVADSVGGMVPYLGTGVHLAEAGNDFASGDIMGGVLNTAESIPVVGSVISAGESIFNAISGGGSVVCTALADTGGIPRSWWYAGTLHFHQRYPELAKRAYYFWAVPAAAHIRRNKNSGFSKFLRAVFYHRAEWIAAECSMKSARKTLLGAAAFAAVEVFTTVLGVLCLPVLPELSVAAGARYPKQEA